MRDWAYHLRFLKSIFLTYTQHHMMYLPHNWLLSAVNYLLVALVKILIWKEYFTLYNITNVGRNTIYEALEKVSLSIDYFYYDEMEKLTHMYNKHENSQSAELHLDAEKVEMKFPCKTLNWNCCTWENFIFCSFLYTHAFLKTNYSLCCCCVKVLDTLCTRLLFIVKGEKLY